MAFSQEIVYTVTTSVFPPFYNASAPSTITSLTVTPNLTPPPVNMVAALPVISASGLAFGPDSNLYVTDRNTNRILVVNPTNGYTSIYADLTPGVAGGPTVAPGGLAFNGNDLYVSRLVGLQAAPNSGALDRYTFTSTGNVPNTPTFSSAVVTNQTQPAGITIAPAMLAGSSTPYQYAGQVFIASLGYSNFLLQDVNGQQIGTPGQVTCYNPIDNQSTTFIANATTPEGYLAGTHLLSASAVKFGPDGSLYVVDTIGNSVRKYNADTRAYLGDFINTGLDFPSDIIFDSQNRAWVSNLGDETTRRAGSIKRFDMSGTYIDTVANSGYYAQLSITPEPTAILGMCSLAGLAILRWKGQRRV